MTDHRWLRLSGWGMGLAAAALLATFLPAAWRFDFPPAVPFLIAILLTTLGELGMRVRYGARAGRAGQASLDIGIAGGVAATVGGLLWATGFSGRGAMNASMAVMFGGLFVFGWVAIRRKPMPRGNVLPLLAGLWWPLIFLVSSVLGLADIQLDVSFGASLLLFLAMCIPLALLGYRTQADIRANRHAAP